MAQVAKRIFFWFSQKHSDIKHTYYAHNYKWTVKERLAKHHKLVTHDHLLGIEYLPFSASAHLSNDVALASAEMPWRLILTCSHLLHANIRRTLANLYNRSMLGFVSIPRGSRQWLSGCTGCRRGSVLPREGPLRTLANRRCSNWEIRQLLNPLRTAQTPLPLLILIPCLMLTYFKTGFRRTTTVLSFSRPSIGSSINPRYSPPWLFIALSL